MGDKKTKQREQIEQKYKWNIENMFPNEADWDKDFNTVMELADSYERFSGRLGESEKVLLEALQERDKIWMIAEKAYVYELSIKVFPANSAGISNSLRYQKSE